MASIINKCIIYYFDQDKETSGGILENILTVEDDTAPNKSDYIFIDGIKYKIKSIERSYSSGSSSSVLIVNVYLSRGKFYARMRNYEK